jgi:hypothetical protein
VGAHGHVDGGVDYMIERFLPDDPERFTVAEPTVKRFEEIHHG